MALELVRALAETELDDNLHMARLLMLLSAHAGKSGRPVEGVTKLAKLDFLLRYPNCLERALDTRRQDSADAHIEGYERTTIESKMVRFRYGPWDHRYRRWIAILVGKGLVRVDVEGRTVKLWLTEKGQTTALQLARSKDLSNLAERAKLVARQFGAMSGSSLKAFVYETFPEITNMRWGDPITL
jgi:hypothetical protein